MADLTNTYMGLSSFDFTGGFNILGKPEALDSRVTVSNIAYIYEPTHWSFTDKNGKSRTILPYPGLIVGDHSGKAMICVNADQTVVTEDGVQKPKYCLKSSWKEIGGAALVAATAADFTALTVTENVGKTLYVSSKITVGEGEAAVEYSTGLYVIIGVGSVNKLEASTTGGVDLASLSSEIETLKGDETKEGSVKHIAKGYADAAYSYAGEAHTKADEAKALITNLNSGATVKDGNNHVSFTYAQVNGLVNISGLTVSGLATSTYADSLGAKIDTLVGTYAGDNAKAVRTIAAEEVAKICASSYEAYDTLQEIGYWIANHPTDVAAMNAKISAIEGSYVAADNALSARIKTLEDAGFLTEHQDLSAYATKTYVGQEIAKIVIPTKLSAFTNDCGYITISDVNTALTGYATQQWVEDKKYLTEHQDLSSYATKDYVGQQGYITADHLSTNGYVTSDWVTNQGYLTEHQSLDGYATEQWVIDQNYLTEHQDLSDYAKKTWVAEQGYVTANYVSEEIGKIVIPTIPTSLSAFINDCGYVTSTWVTEQGYLTDHQDLSDYATKQWVEDKKYLTQHQDLSSYATKVYVGEAIGGLTYSDKAIAGYYVSAVQQSNGVIAVERTALPEYVHPDYSTTYAAYHSTYTLEKLGTEIATNEAVTAAALNKLNEDYTALASNYATLLASFNELLAKVAVYDKKFGYVAATETEEATFKYDYLRIDDCED